MNQRGAILLYVLVTGAVVSVVTAGVLRMTMMNHVATARTHAGTQNRKEADAMLYRAVTYWNSGKLCDNIPDGFSCIGPNNGTCNCKCPNPTAVPRIEAADVAGVCTVTLTSSDPP